MCLQSAFASFFLSSYSALRHLHSFPTRRSSDLGHALAFEPDSKQPGIFPKLQLSSGGVFVGNIRSGHFNCLCLSIYTPDRKSTRLNSSHVRISYAVFCLKKKNALSI